MTDQLQLPGYCWRCADRRVLAVETTDRHGDPVVVPTLCPDCRPHPSRRETWLAAVKLARRLVAEPPADGR